MSDKRTEISSIGEFGLIERIQRQSKIQNTTTLKGIGDDAAIVEGGNESLLVSTDMLVEGVHFDLSYVPLQHLGYKSVAVNVSDIAAMNGTPQQILVSLGISNRFSVEAVDALYDGIRAACDNYKVDNDIICVTGDLGAAYLGLQVLEREKQVFLTNPEMQPDLEKYQYLVGRQLKPEARMDIIHELADKNCVPTSMIDISDGLASELLHLGKNSNLGVKIFEDKVPIDHGTFETAIEFNLDPITCALNGGEDYELLFTIAPSDYEKIKTHPDIHFIGHMHDNPNQHVMVTKQQTLVPVTAQGWNHFLKKS
jgi:thiamine-monophosphate kinase